MAELSATERINERTRTLDQLPLLERLQIINDEDARVAPAIRKCLPQIGALTELFTETVQRGKRVLFVGAGTSGRLGLMEAAECPPTFGLDADTIRALMAGGAGTERTAVEGAEDDEGAGRADIRSGVVEPGDLVIGLSASGNTPYVLAALQEAKALGTKTAAIVCNTTDLEGQVDVLVTAVVGPEVVTGSTRMKAGTAQKMILNMVTTASMASLGRIYGNLMVDLKPSNVKLRQRAGRIVRQATGVDQATASRALEQSGGEVKVAILTLLCAVPPDEARVLLENAKGHIHEVLAQGHGGQRSPGDTPPNTRGPV
jgi:N-acetylmuramic acid 6-phosphate etherase